MKFKTKKTIEEGNEKTREEAGFPFSSDSYESREKRSLRSSKLSLSQPMNGERRRQTDFKTGPGPGFHNAFPPKFFLKDELFTKKKAQLGWLTLGGSESVVVPLPKEAREPLSICSMLPSREAPSSKSLELKKTN